MKKANIILSIFNVILSITLIVMILLYLNAIKISKTNLDNLLVAAEETFEANKKISELEEELDMYRNTGIRKITNTLSTNTAVSSEPYIPDGMEVADSNDSLEIKVPNFEFNRSPENVKIEVIEGTATNTSVEILITDNNEDKYGWGADFAIQEKVNGEWKDLEYITDDIGWILIAYNLDENNQLKQELDIEEYYGKLEKGTYRVVKTIYDNEYRDLYSNEFEIK